MVNRTLFGGRLRALGEVATPESDARKARLSNNNSFVCGRGFGRRSTDRKFWGYLLGQRAHINGVQGHGQSHAVLISEI